MLGKDQTDAMGQSLGMPGVKITWFLFIYHGFSLRRCCSPCASFSWWSPACWTGSVTRLLMAFMSSSRPMLPTFTLEMTGIPSLPSWNALGQEWNHPQLCKLQEEQIMTQVSFIISKNVLLLENLIPTCWMNSSWLSLLPSQRICRKTQLKLNQFTLARLRICVVIIVGVYVWLTSL